nr:MAG TPA: hypothetical protein [Caudoviricetes sp.]
MLYYLIALNLIDRQIVWSRPQKKSLQNLFLLLLELPRQLPSTDTLAV